MSCVIVQRRTVRLTESVDTEKAKKRNFLQSVELVKAAQLDREIFTVNFTSTQVSVKKVETKKFTLFTTTNNITQKIS
jgi:hypothetical protein